MDDKLIETQLCATRIACRRITGPHLKALCDSVEQACRIPATFAWDRKAAAHAEIFSVLADTVHDPLVSPVLRSGVGLTYSLMVMAGQAADGMTASSRRRLLAHLRARDAEKAALEMEKHLQVLHYMSHLANRDGS